MADGELRVVWVPVKFPVKGFRGSLITYLISDFQNSNWLTLSKISRWISGWISVPNLHLTMDANFSASQTILMNYLMQFQSPNLKQVLYRPRYSSVSAHSQSIERVLEKTKQKFPYKTEKFHENCRSTKSPLRKNPAGNPVGKLWRSFHDFSGKFLDSCKKSFKKCCSKY